MTTPLTLHIGTSLDAIRPAHATAMAWLEANGIPAGTGVLASLAIDEIVTNCIKYAYDDEQEHNVELRMELEGDQLVLRFRDDGRPFNPLDVAPPDLSLAIEQRPVGGLGIFLLRTMADEMRYERQDGFNCVTLRKKVQDVE